MKLRHLAAIYNAALFVPLGGCATTAQLANDPPAAVYHSDRARDVIAECLIDRLSDTDIIPDKQVSDGVTTVGFTVHGGLTRPGLYHFTIRDDGQGSVVEARTLHGLVKMKLTTAETCF